MERCIICLGSNQDGEYHLLRATESISSIFPHIRWGQVIQTIPEGTDYPAPYFNRAAIFSTGMNLEQIQDIFKSIEVQHGRTPSSKSSGIIPLDIDLLVYGDLVLKPADMQKHYVHQALNSVL